MTEQPPFCLACGFALCKTPWSLFPDLRSLTCTHCGGIRRRQCDAEASEHAVAELFKEVLALMLWPLVAIALIAIAVCLAYPAHADQDAQERMQYGRELRQQQIDQAAAASMAEGAPASPRCYQVRRHGQAAVCISREEWGRMHEADQPVVVVAKRGSRL